MIEITVFVTTSTELVASPSASPLTTDVVTASSGQSPSSCTSAGLSRQKPTATTSRRPLLFCIGVAAGGCGGAEEFVTMALEV